MKTKTNHEIIKEFEEKLYKVGFQKLEGIQLKLLLGLLETKDKQARQEKIELVESVPSYHVNGDSNGGFIYPYPSVKKWKNEKLKQLKS